MRVAADLASRLDGWVAHPPSILIVDARHRDAHAALDAWIGARSRAGAVTPRLRVSHAASTRIEWHALVALGAALADAIGEEPSDEEEKPDGVGALWSRALGFLAALGPDEDAPDRALSVLVLDDLGALADPAPEDWQAFLATAVQFAHVVLVESTAPVPEGIFARLSVDRIDVGGASHAAAVASGAPVASPIAAAILEALSAEDFAALGLGEAAEAIVPAPDETRRALLATDAAKVGDAVTRLATRSLELAAQVGSGVVAPDAVARYAVRAGGSHASETDAPLECCRVLLSAGWFAAWHLDPDGPIGFSADVRRVRRLAAERWLEPRGEAAFSDLLEATIVEAVSVANTAEPATLESPMLELTRAQGLAELAKVVPDHRAPFEALIRRELDSIRGREEIASDIDAIESSFGVVDVQRDAAPPSELSAAAVEAALAASPFERASLAIAHPRHFAASPTLLEAILEGLDDVSAVEVRATVVPYVADASLRARLLAEAVERQLRGGDDDSFARLTLSAAALTREQAAALVLARLGHDSLRRLLRPHGNLAAVAPLLPRASSPKTLLAAGEVIATRARPLSHR
ncbi:MAG: hypothetical protein HOW73_39755 [Polyangiaceae bacterium]|nr:hypothetical protein [Polyangiaceae bacterium]